MPAALGILLTCCLAACVSSGHGRAPRVVPAPAPAPSATPAQPPPAASPRPAAGAPAEPDAAGAQPSPNAAAAPAGETPPSPAGEASPGSTTFVIPEGAPAPAAPAAPGKTGPPPAPQGGGGSVAPATPPAPGTGLILSVSMSRPNARVGDEITVRIDAVAQVGVVDAPLHVQYDPEILRFIEAQEGDFMKSGGAATVFLVNSESRPGDALVGIGRTGRSSGAYGHGVLCVIRFVVLAPGTARVAIGPALAWGVSGALLPVTTGAAEIPATP